MGLLGWAITALIVAVVAGALGFFIYNVPLLALNTIVRLAQLCLNS